MKLPDMQFGATPDEVSPALERVGAAARGLGDTVSQGLYQFHQELVKTEANDAHLDLLKGMGDLTTTLKTQKSFSPDDLKLRLGEDGYSQIPQEVRDQAERPTVVFDDKGAPVMGADGQPQMAPAGVPTFMVADSIFKAQAAKVLEGSQQKISGQGWRSAFARAALPDIIAHGNALNDAMIEQAHKFQASAVVRQALAYAYEGMPDLAMLRLDSGLSALGKEGQAEAQITVGKVIQAKPVFDALQAFNKDPFSDTTRAGLLDAQKRLDDPAATSYLDPQHKEAMSSRIRTALKETDPAKRQVAAAALEIAQTKRDPMNPDLIDPKAAYDAVDAFFLPGGRFFGHPELRDDTQAAVKKDISDRNEIQTRAYENAGATGILQYLSIDAEGRYHPGSANLTPQVRAALAASGEKGAMLLNTFRSWDGQNESSARSRANTPSEAESARAFLIERSMAKRPGEWRAMSATDQLAILAGKAPIPGEADAPEVMVSARDVPGLSKRLADISAPPSPGQVTTSSLIAHQEAENAFPSLKTKKPTEGHRVALHELEDRLSRYVGDEINRTGKPPADEDQRAFVRKQLQDVEVLKKFWFNGTWPRVEAETEGRKFIDPETGAPIQPPTPEKRAALQPGQVVAYDDKGNSYVTTREAARRGLPKGHVVEGGVVGQDAAPARAPAPKPAATPRLDIPPRPADAPADWVPYLNTATNEVRYNAPGKAKGAWKEAR